MEDWKRVIFSDETKINRLDSDGRKWAWKLPGEGLTDRLAQGTLKFGGGSVMVWGCMSWAGVGNCCRMDGRMDGDLYTAILDEDVMDSISHFGKTPSDTVFQQDSDPKHACKKARTGSKTTRSSSCYGQHSLQTSIPSSTSDSTSRGGLEGTPHHLEGYWSFGRGWRRSGSGYQHLDAGI